ncbi:MAG: L-glutamate gamma-semialdehyde dehydrogenase [Deltaproteobacteria bacterium]|nr:L-glutamate gamma-semialdehyde dehydrogenase [Deltaproteobacteria bacterium]
MALGLYHPPTPINEPILSYAPGTQERKTLKAALDRFSPGAPKDLPLVIGGKRRKGAGSMDVTCPHAKREVLARCAQANTADAEAAVGAALAAQKDWSRFPFAERASVFLKAADRLAGEYRAEINAATMMGQGKSVHQAEIDAACELIDFLRFNVYFAQKIYESQPLYSPRGLWNRSEARALEGFVFAVGPFNFTAISVNLATAPALMGCTVVWKPAPTAVLASYLMLEVLEKSGLPPGVINFIAGEPEVMGKTVLGNPNLAGIHFTGSTTTFQHLWSTVGQNIASYKTYPRIVGETGGKDFVFAHSSADPQELITALIRGAFEYQGQKCSAASRAFIPRTLWKQIKDKLVAETEMIKMGDPRDFSNFMNAVIDARAFVKIKGYIDHAKQASDAKILCGGECDDSVGYFVRPTIIEAINPLYRSMTEEIFGPVLTIYVYDDNKEAEAVKLCEESTAYGLTGAVMACDRMAIDRLSRSFLNTAGNFYINDKPTGAVVGQQAFGGGRKSGTNDKAGSEWNLARWVSFRSVKENFLPLTDYRYDFMKEG